VENIENWYEKILFGKIRELSQTQLDHADDQAPFDSAMWSDIACLALNHLPPRYVRHSVDMRFYLSPQEHEEMDERVEAALQNAITYVKQHPSAHSDTAQSAQIT
jgi:hypothetical protein